jgi:hypothetical protein
VTARHRQRAADARADALADLEQILDEGGAAIEHRVVAEVRCGDGVLPVHVVSLGKADPELPAVGLFAGVHGLERIGTEVVVAFLGSLVRRLRWDDALQRQLETLRLVCMPLVNPGGALRGTRANPNGVDLMRNAPVDAVASVPWLVGGQRVSALLPWYRGPAGAAMEAESQALCDIVRSELIARPFSVALDCHSGFGAVDRIWFPYAHSTAPIAHLAEVHALAEIFEQSQPHHRYVFEPQSRQYLTHGDLWDHLYLDAARRTGSTFLPLTLELGSWLWVKKNPRQLFSRSGLFNPGLAHRHRRVLRSHMPWLEFLLRAAASSRRWLPRGVDREHHARAALVRWYEASP